MIGGHRGGAVETRGRSGAMSGPYDRQLIIHLKVSGPADDVIAKGSRRLNKRAAWRGIPSEIIEITTSGPNVVASHCHAAFNAALKKLTSQSRVYLRGHGNWKSQTLAGWDAKCLASCLGWFGMPAVKVISITGCSLARDRGTADDARMASSCDSFAGKFHFQLAVDKGIHTIVYARLNDVAVVGSDESGVPWSVGTKLTTRDDSGWDDDDGDNHRPGSKMKFWWVGKTQHRRRL